MKKAYLQTVVVNITKGSDYDVYIGRPSKWGNPFRLTDHANDRQLIVKKYYEWFHAPKAMGIERCCQKRTQWETAWLLLYARCMSWSCTG